MQLHFQFTLWKFPGGLATLAEDIGNTYAKES